MQKNNERCYLLIKCLVASPCGCVCYSGGVPVFCLPTLPFPGQAQQTSHPHIPTTCQDAPSKPCKISISLKGAIMWVIFLIQNPMDSLHFVGQLLSSHGGVGVKYVWSELLLAHSLHGLIVICYHMHLPFFKEHPEKIQNFFTIRNVINICIYCIQRGLSKRAWSICQEFWRNLC